MRSFVYSFCSFIHLFVHPFIRSFVHPFILSFVHPFIRSFVFLSFVCLFIRSFVHILIFFYLFTHSFFNSFIRSSFHLLILVSFHPFIHPVCSLYLDWFSQFLSYGGKSDVSRFCVYHSGLVSQSPRWIYYIQVRDQIYIFVY